MGQNSSMLINIIVKSIVKSIVYLSFWCWYWYWLSDTDTIRYFRYGIHPYRTEAVSCYLHTSRSVYWSFTYCRIENIYSAICFAIFNIWTYLFCNNSAILVFFSDRLLYKINICCCKIVIVERWLKLKEY